MEFKKKDLVEIINTNGELIGNKNIPDVEANADTQANGTTDQNAKIGTQPYRYDMLGRFGFTLMPFMEGEERNEGQEELMNDLVDLMYEKYLDILKYYFKNPKKIKSDYRKHITDGSSPEDTDKEWAAKIMKVVEKHFEESLKNLDEQFKENIAEGKVIEDKMVDRKEDEMAEKSEDNEIKEKKLEKIAGLINKLEKKDIDKLINLLEKKNG